MPRKHSSTWPWVETPPRGLPNRWLLPPQTEITPMQVNLHKTARITLAIGRELRESQPSTGAGDEFR